MAKVILEGAVFQSPIGTQKTKCILRGQGLIFVVSIPYRYTKNPYAYGYERAVITLFQSPIGTQKTYLIYYEGFQF